MQGMQYPPSDEGVEDGLVDEKAAQRRAALAGRANSPEHGRAQSEVHVGVRHDDGGVVAAQLQDGAPDCKVNESGEHSQRTVDDQWHYQT